MSENVFVYGQAENSSLNQTSHYWQHYDLKQSPFEDYPQFAMYFPIAHWQANLKYLQQFCAGPRPLLLIEGEFGIGKTMLLAQFLTQLSVDVTSYQIKGKATITAAQLIAELAQGLQLPITLSQPTLSEQMAAELAILRHLQKTCLLVIDDADLLPTETLATLLSLAAMQDPNRLNLYILLTCELDLQSHLENLAREQGQQLYIPSLTLSPLSLEETKSYVKHRLVKAGLSDKMPFNKEMIQYIYQLSGGIPGRINRVAQQILMDLLKPSEHRIPLYKSTERDRSFLKVADFRMISLIIMSFLIAGVFIYQLEKTLRPEIHHSIAMSEENIPAKPMQKLVATPPMQTIQQVHVQPAKVANNTIQPIPAVTPENVQAVEAPTANMVTNMTEVMNSAPPKTMINPPIEIQKPTQNEIPAKTDDKSYSAAEKKLLAMQGYTLQVMGSRRLSDLKQFMAQHQLPAKNFMQFKTQYLGKPWYVLVYGNYEGVQQAKLVVNRLPKFIQSMHPWIRPMASVHQAIKQR